MFLNGEGTPTSTEGNLFSNNFHSDWGHNNRSWSPLHTWSMQLGASQCTKIIHQKNIHNNQTNSVLNFSEKGTLESAGGISGLFFSV